MKNIIIVFGGLIVIAGTGFALTQLLDNDESSTNQTSQTTNQQIDTQKNNHADELPADTQESGDTGSYVEYSDSAIANAEGDSYLFFHAPWCPQCRSIERGITSDGVPDGVTIIKVDYDSNQDLRSKYGVTLQTTFVKVDNDGNEVSKFVAYNDPQFSSVVRDYINKES